MWYPFPLVLEDSIDIESNDARGGGAGDGKREVPRGDDNIKSSYNQLWIALI